MTLHMAKTLKAARQPPTLQPPWRKFLAQPYAPWALAGALALFTLIAFWSVSDCGFVNLDDDKYVTQNPPVATGLSWPNLKWAMTSKVNDLYHPLSLMTFMVDTQFFGVDARELHLANLALHVVNAMLLLGMLRSLTGDVLRSSIVALLWAVHPLRVESVAWIAERKDLLCLMFGLLAIWLYADYARRGGLWRYALVIIMMILSLLAKPLLVTLPGVLLLLDYWPLRRRQTPWWRLVLEKLPIILVGFIFVLVASRNVVDWLGLHQTAIRLHLMDELPPEKPEAQLTPIAWGPGGPPPAPPQYPFPIGERARSAAVCCVRYLQKMVDFRRLAPWYPQVRWSAAQVYASAALLLAITLAALALWRFPWLAAGWLWFLLILAPLLNIILISDYSMADRYTYMAGIGILMMLIWSIPDRWLARPAGFFALVATVGAIAIVLLIFTRRQIDYWSDSITLWQHTLDVTGDNEKAQSQLGQAYLAENRFADAIEPLREASRLAPWWAKHHYNLGFALQMAGDPQGALGQYQAALVIRPKQVDTLTNLGTLLADRGDLPGATADHQRAVEIDPADATAGVSLGLDLLAAGKLDEAAAEFKRVAGLHPTLAAPHESLAQIFLMQKQYAAAADEATVATRLNPDSADAFADLARAQMALGHLDPAIAAYNRAVTLDPINPATAQERMAAIEKRRSRQP